MLVFPPQAVCVVYLSLSQLDKQIDSHDNI